MSNSVNVKYRRAYLFSCVLNIIVKYSISMLMPFIRHLGEILCVKEMKYDSIYTNVYFGQCTALGTGDLHCYILLHVTVYTD